jgi:fibronectin type 3 domain-containing protein
MVSGTTYDDRDASPGVVYWYKVKACNASGCSAFSAPDSGFTFASAPDPVTNVSATDGTYTDRVRVTWTAVTGAANYEVHRAESEDGTYTRRATVTGASYDDTGVTQGTTYWYKVTACNTAGCSAFSVPDSGYASTGGGGGGGGGGTGDLPGQPQNVTASDGTDKEKIVVTWSSVSGATRYEIWRCITGNDDDFVRYGETTTTSFNDTVQTMCEVFWYRVRAGNAVGWGPDSVADSGYRGGTLEQVNASKVEVTVTPATDTTANVTLEWEAVKDATLFNVRYEIWRRGTAGALTLVHTTGVGSLAWTDEGLPFGTTYYYKIRAVSTFGCIVAGPFSGEVQVTVACNPAAPTGVNAEPLADNDIKISWSAVNGATYEVYRATGTTGSYVKIGSTTLSSFIDRPPGPVPPSTSVTYYYKVKTCMACGCGGLSAASNGVTIYTIP